MLRVFCGWRSRWIVLIASASVVAGGLVAVGAEIRYPSKIQTKIGAETFRLDLTGTAIRKIYGFSVYAIGSYVQEGSTIRGAEDLVSADVLKQLHLVLLRDVDGDDMAKSFEASIGLNNPPGAFAAELRQLNQFLARQSVKKGDHAWLTYQPKVGFRCYLAGRGEVVIRSVPFARALWEVYLGPKNVGVAIKTGLTSRL